MQHFLQNLADTIWSTPLAIFLLGSGLFFTIYCIFPQIRFFYHAARVIVGRYVKPRHAEISNFEAFCKAISSPIGLGSIVGVAIALSVAGPGAIFWMWVAGFLGMATKMFSISLAVMFRSDEKIGPMYTIKNGLGSKFHFLASVFAALTVLTSFFAGNIFQSNQIGVILNTATGLPHVASALIFTLLTALVLVGRKFIIKNTANRLAPLMVALYTFGSAYIIINNFNAIPGIFNMIITDAFKGDAVVGGATGLAFRHVLIHGVRRALFSNEAGLGSAALEERKLNLNPVQQGIVGIIGPFVDTIIVSTMTALVIIMAGTWAKDMGIQGVELSASAFTAYFGNTGKYIITIQICIFAFSTIISWAYFGEKAVTFLLGNKSSRPFRILFSIAVLAGPFLSLKTILNIADPILGLLLIPNLLANIILAPNIKKALKKYRRDLKAERI